MAKQVLNEPIDVIENKIHKLSPDLLSILLKDNSTGENLYWATSTYEKYGDLYAKDKQMLPELMIGPNIDLLTPRVSKTQEEQQARTKDKGEVFTPAWMCNKQINYIDEDWFGRADVFNTETEDGWKANKNKISFPKESGKAWEQYVTNPRIEITCGEAPYLVSRYDVVKGEVIPVEDRIGILDRKLRAVNENVDDEKEWISWSIKAYQSTYGYDYQGDNVLIARENLLYTLIDNMIYKFNHQPNLKILKRFSKIISWNIWQMDGLNCIVPHSSRIKEDLQIRLFDFEDEEQEREPIEAIIKNWKTGKNIIFKDLKGCKKGMKFDYCVGNPAYQKEVENNNRQTPIYNLFMESSYEFSNCSLLITPARFLFNAGQTPKAWNEKMLKDEHFKVLYYEPNASKIFSNTEIKGGVAITIKNNSKCYGEIGIFTQYKELNTILDKVLPFTRKENISNLFVGAVPYKYSINFKEEHPELKEFVGKSFDLRTNAFEKLINIIYFENPHNMNNPVKIYGIYKQNRIPLYVERRYLDVASNFDKYKVLISKANGSGIFGEALSQLIVIEPNAGHTQSFISVGYFNSFKEADNLAKYIKCKFTRCLLSVLRVTQDTTPFKWKYIPLQDYTDKSDIDWSKSIREIDQQLYKKYDLSQEEIEFIETHVKEME